MYRYLSLVALATLLALACGGGQKKSDEPAKAEAAEAKPAEGDAAAPAEGDAAATAEGDAAATAEGEAAATAEDNWWEKSGLFRDGGEGQLMLCGVGAAPARNLGIARERADNYARREILKFLGTVTQQIETEKGITLKSEASGMLQGVMMMDTHKGETEIARLGCLEIEALRSMDPWKAQPEFVDAVVEMAKKALGK